MSSLDPANTLPPATGQSDGVAIAGAAAFVIILVSSTIGWGLWMAYRTTKIMSTATKTRVAQRVPPCHTGTYVSEMSALEMGTPFPKSGSCNDWEPTRLPYLRSQNSELSTYLPALPERAYVSGWVPFPPSIPRCQTLDAVRSPITVSHSTSDLCGVELVLGTPNNSAHQAKGAQVLLSPPMNLINFDEEGKEHPVVPSTPCVGLGLSLLDIETITDDFTVKSGEVPHAPLQVETSLLDSASGNKLSNHGSLDPVPTPPHLPTPLITPILPTLVLTSAPFKSRPDDKPEQTNLSQLASPPATPTLLLTAPSVHCGLSLSVEGAIDRDVDDELESWSDILGFQEYEDSEDQLDHATHRLLDDFPSPPELQAQSSILNVPQLASSDHDEHSESSVNGGSATALQVTDDEHVTHEVEDKVEEAPFDYVAFRERLAEFLKDVEDQKKLIPTFTVEDTDQNASVTTSALATSSSSTHFDYGRLRARKRSQTLLSNHTASKPQVDPLKIVPRPLPLPVELPPLLYRPVDRSKRQAPL